MKIITMFSGKSYVVENDEAQNVSKMYNAGSLIELRCGAQINPRGIESIDDHVIKKWSGHTVYEEKSSGRQFFQRDGEKIFLGDNEVKQIETIKIDNQKLLK